MRAPTAFTVGLLLVSTLLLAAVPATAHHGKGSHAGDDAGTDEPASPCQDWSGNATEDLPGPAATSDDGCIVHIENQPPNCVGPWGISVGQAVGPASVRVNACGPPGGIAEPASAEGPSCEDWAHDVPEQAGISDDGCLAHVDTNQLYACVGPWYREKTTNVGPVAITLLICQPPGGSPT